MSETARFLASLAADAARTALLRGAVLATRAGHACRLLGERCARVAVGEVFYFVDGPRVIAWGGCEDCSTKPNDECEHCGGTGRLTYDVITGEVERLF